MAQLGTHCADDDATLADGMTSRFFLALTVFILTAFLSHLQGFGVCVLLLSVFKCPYYLPINVILGLMMYATYFYLFAQLFYEMYLGTRQEAYVPPNRQKAVREREVGNDENHSCENHSDVEGRVNHDGAGKLKVD
jgi:hypothetical protein